MGREGELRLVVVRELSLAKTLVLVWWGVARRKTMFVEPVSVPQTDPHSECDVSYVYSKESKPRRSRFSVSRFGSLQRVCYPA